MRYAAMLVLVSLGCAPAMAASTRSSVLHLSETASVAVKADEIVARLQAVGEASSAAAAQQAVNAAMAKAVARARAVAGIALSTGNYAVWQDDKGRWHASQSLRLQGRDGAAMLALAGALQADGLTTQGLDWQVSSVAAEAAQKAATMKALAVLRARAGQIAAALGLHVDSIARLTVSEGSPAPRPMPMMMMAARAATPPSAVAPDDLREQAGVSADVLLKP